MIPTLARKKFIAVVGGASMGLLELKLEIVKQGKQKQEIARSAGIHATRLSKILGGWVQARPDELNAIRQCLGLEEFDDPADGHATSGESEKAAVA